MTLQRHEYTGEIVAKELRPVGRWFYWATKPASFHLHKVINLMWQSIMEDAEDQAYGRWTVGEEK